MKDEWSYKLDDKLCFSDLGGGYGEGLFLKVDIRMGGRRVD